MNVNNIVRIEGIINSENPIIAKTNGTIFRYTVFIGVARSYKGEDGKRPYDHIPVEFCGEKLCEIISRDPSILQQGRVLSVVGSIETRSWQSNGNWKNAWGVHVDQFFSTEKSQNAPQQISQAQPQQIQPQAQPQQVQPQVQPQQIQPQVQPQQIQPQVQPQQIQPQAQPQQVQPQVQPQQEQNHGLPFTFL